MGILIETKAKASRISGPIAGNDATSTSIPEVIAALSFALDLTEGQPPGHAVRSCVFGMRIAEETGIPLAARGDLYYAFLMKDAGCSTNSSRMVQLLGTDDIQAKKDVKTTDWTKIGWESLQYAISHVKPGAPFLERVQALFHVAINQKKNAHEMVRMRCERGASIARRLGLKEATALAIHSLDELWNGAGQPDGLRGEEIPLFSRIMNLSQTLDVFYSERGPAAAVEIARKRSGTWFDPNLVKAFRSLAKSTSLWEDVANASKRVLGMEPPNTLFAGTPADHEATLDNICLAFADVIDAKSPFTYRHSAGVAGAAVAIGRTLGLDAGEIALLRRAALLHDIGKLSVSNSILDKPGKLTDEEWQSVHKHPYYSHEILKRVPGFADLSEIAASHHEKLDGSGYYRNMGAAQLSLPARILAVADIYDALSARRPYRDAMPLEKVFAIIQMDSPRALDIDCFEALKCSSNEAAVVSADLLRLSEGVNSCSPVS